LVVDLHLDHGQINGRFHFLFVTGIRVQKHLNHICF
jgi:hypothetical protein